MHATVDLCPGDLARVFALEEEGGILGAGEAEDLRCAGMPSQDGKRAEGRRDCELWSLRGQRVSPWKGRYGTPRMSRFRASILRPGVCQCKHSAHDQSAHVPSIEMRSPVEKTVSPDERKDLKTSRRHPHAIHTIQPPTLSLSLQLSPYASDGLTCYKMV